MTASASEEKAPSPATAAAESLSELLARILHQLSVSAWLPAGALVFIALLYGNLATHSNDLGKAIAGIGAMNFPSLILLIAAVVLLTMATQAFEFEGIRLLEGYWGAGLIGRSLARLGCKRHLKRRERLKSTIDDLKMSAFGYARLRMLDKQVPSWVVDVLEADEFARQHTPPANKDHKEAHRVDWRHYARPSDVRRLHDLATRWQDYPKMPHRVLPTKLGNILRSREEILYDPTRGSMEGMIMRVYDQLPASVRKEHDRYRGRLDLYCSLVMVLVVGAVAAWPALFNGDWKPPVLALGVSLVLAWFSYRAAIASARGYGVVLETVRRLTDRGAIR